jgi:hypothetical protein
MRYYTSPHSFKCFTLVKYCGFPNHPLYEYLVNVYFPEFTEPQLMNALNIIWNFTSLSYLETTYGQDWHPDYENCRYYADVIREPDYRTTIVSEHHPRCMECVHRFLNTNLAEFFRGYVKFYFNGDLENLNAKYQRALDNNHIMVAYCIYAFYHPENSFVSISETFDYFVYYNPDHVNLILFINKMYLENLQ